MPPETRKLLEELCWREFELTLEEVVARWKNKEFAHGEAFLPGEAFLLAGTIATLYYYYEKY